MKSVSQKAARKQVAEEKKKAKAKVKIVLYANKHGVGAASIKYKEHPSNIKRWRKQYDGDWRSLMNKSRRPHSHPRQHTLVEESRIMEVWGSCGYKGIEYAYAELVRNYGYARTLWGLYHALRRLGPVRPPKKKGRRNYRKPRTPWHNGKVERSHRMDQRYFYDWESFRNMTEFNGKPADWREWTNHKPMRIFHGKSPAQKLEDYMWLI